ncbi:mycofactocin biosynthesis glycosyltransferase MftF [Blastococcus sp. SYSU D00820]
MTPPPGPAVGAPPDLPLPAGYAVRLAPGTRRRNGGTVLLGGSPMRQLRLRPRARDLLHGDRLVVADRATATLAARLLDTGLANPELPDVADGGPAVTVVVPVRDRTAGLVRLLAAVRADPATATVPVLVADDGSADAAGVAAAAAAHGAEVLRAERSGGPAAARNRGLRAARTPVVAFLDSDCVPRPGWLAPLLRHLADPRLALVAPRIVALGPGSGWPADYEALASALDMGARPRAVRPGTALSYVPSAALLARRDALGDGFDERLPVAEDVDLVWRLCAAGWRVRYEPAAQVAHDHRTGVRDWLRRRAFYGTGAAPLAARHGAAVAPLVVSPWSAAAWGLALTGGWPGRVVSAGVLAEAARRLAGRLAAPGEPRPYALAAGLVARGSLVAGRTLARAATRHHWPVAGAAALRSRRARRLLAAAAVADGLAGWWPHRDRIGPGRFLAARLLEDLAYGAGLWTGAARARSPRALLPARPPRI